MISVKCTDVRWEAVELFGKPVLFSEEQIDRCSVPSGICMYEVRHNSEDWGEPCEIKDNVIVNFLGTVLSDEPIELEDGGFRLIDPEEDWWYLGEYSSISEYISDITSARKMNYER
ncbi:MAG: hypothetical protein IJM44_08330 [Ruminococcus sp.]|nr:hypothetical protein [Ruminococcus sp.]